ncbi:MAG: SDR family oxidoreductase [Ignavibacteriae bacterium]|nr:SDR family oxidoreductase [Ignavibacteriota bacterium]
MINGKVVVVTGGCGLIGQSFVEAIVKNGGIAIAADLNIEAIEKVKNLYSNKQNKVDAVVMDITKKDSVKNAINYIQGRYGKIDALVNNAYPRNKNYGKHFFEVEYEDFCENVGLNLGGYFLTSQQFAEYFKDREEGNIINISSVYGVMVPKFEIYNRTNMTMPVEYAAIKSGLIHLTKYMAQYFKADQIRVNAISPGGILDNQPQSFLNEYKKHCAMKGMLDPSDIVGALIFLLSDHSKYVNGQNIIVDDGFSL